MSEKELKFIKLQEKYLPKIIDIENEAFIDPWTIDMFRMEILIDNSESYALFLGPELIGYGCLRIIEEEGHIMNFAITKDKRSMGYGEKLLKFLLDLGMKYKLKRIFLEVRTTNLPAISLYKKYSFTINRLRYKYYKNKEDAYEMSKDV